MEEEGEKVQGDDKEIPSTFPLAAFHSSIGIVSMAQMDKMSPVGKGLEEHLPRVQAPSESYILVHGRDGPYLMEKAKWPVLTLVDENEPVEGLTQEDSLTGDINSGVSNSSKAKAVTRGDKAIQDDGRVRTEEDLMDDISIMEIDSDFEEERQGWQSPKPRKMKKKFLKSVVVATRTSKRLARNGVPIVEKAASRVMARNKILGNQSANPFTVISNTSASLLENVLNDLNIIVNDAEEQIGVFRAEDLARAALAEANYKVFLEKQKDRDKLRVEDNDGDLTMGVLDNTVRLNPSDSLKVEVFKGFSRNCVESEVTTISKGGGPSATNPC